MGENGIVGDKAMGEDEISEHEAMEQDEILEYEDLEEQFEMQGNLDYGTMPEITEKNTPGKLSAVSWRTSSRTGTSSW